MLIFKPATELLNVLGISKYATLLLTGFLVLAGATIYDAPLSLDSTLLILLAYLGCSGLFILRGDLDNIISIIAARQSDLSQSEQLLSQGRLGWFNNAMLEAIARQRRTKDHFENTLSEINYSSSELKQTVEGVADNIREQSRSTASIATAVTEISYSIDEIGSRISSASELAESNKAKSCDGQAAISDVQMQMKEVTDFIDSTNRQLTVLDEQTHNVAEISASIRGISEQTNLLALNAAIEAARAGEQGRGFSVVADEVRVLANRSHQLAQEITENITRVQDNMQLLKTGMAKVVEHAGATLNMATDTASVFAHIAGNNESISEMISAISDAVAQQNLAAREISENIERVAEVAEQNTHMAQQSSMVAAHLNKLCAPGAQPDV